MYKDFIAWNNKTFSLTLSLLSGGEYVNYLAPMYHTTVKKIMSIYQYINVLTFCI
jgi:hypothetical protein